jgi:hypothetical protein
MEVHAHTHTPRKKWTHYFWEFFMLFLAVTLGFLVENQREHYVEHHREKKFAALLYEDLKKDTAYLNQIIKIKEWHAAKLDSLFYFMALPELQKNATDIYYYSAFINLTLPFNPKDATIQQLRNSGSLRYFSNPRLYNAITTYYSNCAFYMKREEESKPGLFQTVLTKIFRADQLRSITSITPSIRDAVRYPEKQLRLLTTDKATINEFLF